MTYPRTDARVLSTAVSKEIYKNISGLKNFVHARPYIDEILQSGTYKTIAKTRYCNDKQITDHYAIIPTGQGFGALNSLNPTGMKVYEAIVRRFLSIFYPPAEYEKLNLVTAIKGESFFANFKVMVSEGYLKVTHYSFAKKSNTSDKEEDQGLDPKFLAALNGLKKGMVVNVDGLYIKEGETSPPKR